MEILKHVYNTLTRQYEDVEVSEEVYKEYKRSAWSAKNNKKTFFKHEIQMSSLGHDEDDICEFYHELSSGDRQTEDTVFLRIQSAELSNALSELPEKERELLDVLFIKKLTEREYSAILGCSQCAVNKRKKRVLSKLKVALEKNT